MSTQWTRVGQCSVGWYITGPEYPGMASEVGLARESPSSRIGAASQYPAMRKNAYKKAKSRISIVVSVP